MDSSYTETYGDVEISSMASSDNEESQSLITASAYVSLGTYTSRHHAKSQMDALGGGKFRYRHNYRTATMSRSIYTCTSHANCPCLARITHSDGVYTLETTAEHVDGVSTDIRTGIDGFFQPEVDNLLEGGVGPEGCLSILRDRYSNRSDLTDRLPTRAMLKSRKQFLTREDRAEAIARYADLADWAAPRECSTSEHFFGHNQAYSATSDLMEFRGRDADFRHQLIVLRCFSYGDDDGAMGVIMTTRTLLRNVVYAVRGQDGHGVVGAADGTYKMHRGGWTVVDFGTYAVHLDQRQYRHTFVPWAFMFVRSEAFETYSELFSTIRGAVLKFFEIDLVIQFGSLDHSNAIASAFVGEWPGIQTLNCWPHFVRKANENGRRLLRHSEAWENVVLPSLNWLHKARSSKQFTALAAIVTDQLVNDNEREYCVWLSEEYLTDRWKTWFATCSGCPGIIPNQNPIESYHKKIKTANVLSLRASTAYVLNQSLPRILRSASMDSVVGLPITVYCSGPAPPEMVVAAQTNCHKENHRFTFKPRTRRSEKDAVVFNARAYVVGNNNINGISVSNARVQVYLKSLDGILQNDAQVKQIPIDYLSLHKVTILSATVYQHDWESPNWSTEEIRTIRSKYRCDCKAHYSSGWICSHILATLALLDGFDLSRMLKRLPARRPPGRPRKIPRALKKDGEAYFSAVRLMRELPKKPAMALNWLCTLEFKETANGVTSFENVQGKVRSWSNRRGTYHWKVEFDNGTTRQLKVQELAKALEDADATGVAVAGSQ